MIGSISLDTWGAIALHSANRRSVPVSRTAEAISMHKAGTASDTVIESKIWLCSTKSSMVGTSTIPAFSDKVFVRSLLPSRQVNTLSPRSPNNSPTAWPMSPGLRIATVSNPI